MFALCGHIFREQRFILTHIVVSIGGQIDLQVIETCTIDKYFLHFEVSE